MRLLARSLPAAVAGVAAALSFEPSHRVYLLPLAVAALTWLCIGLRPRTGFWMGFVFGTGFMLVLLPWLTVIAVYAWVPLALLEGLFYGIAGLTTAALTKPGTRVPWWPLHSASARLRSVVHDALASLFALLRSPEVTTQI